MQAVRIGNTAQLSCSDLAPGLTIEQLVRMFKWGPHTACAVVSVASK